jgi:hypothetical protein
MKTSVSEGLREICLFRLKKNGNSHFSHAGYTLPIKRASIKNSIHDPVIYVYGAVISRFPRFNRILDNLGEDDPR